jgi:hypothetical protein
MSDRSRQARRRASVERQRLVYFTCGVLLWGFAVLAGSQVLTTAIPLSALLAVCVAGAVLTTLGIADRRDGQLLRSGDLALIDPALVVALTGVSLTFLIAGEAATAVVLGLTAAAVGLSALFTRLAELGR